MIASLARNQVRVVQSFGLSRVLNWALLLILAAAAWDLFWNSLHRGPGYFLQTLIFGVSNGAIYALIALGYTMVYGIIELINFAHADIFTLGAFVSLSLLPVFGLLEGHHYSLLGLAVPMIVITALSMLFCGVFNIGIERVAYRPLRHAPRLSPLITAAGMSFVVEGLMFLWKGPNNTHFPNLVPSTSHINVMGGIDVYHKNLIAMVVTAILLVALNLFVGRSKLGKAMRATAQDKDAAQLMGIDINGTISATFFIAALLAAAGGTIYGLTFNNVVFDLGFVVGLIAFTSAVLGGIGNLTGAALGGFCIGLFEAFWNAGLLSIPFLGLVGTTWTQVMIFGILVLVLVFRPTGLLGMVVADRA